MSELRINKKKRASAQDINGYMVTDPLTSSNAGNCMWGFAEKYGKSFFIKQFLNPKFPDPNADMYENTRKRMVNQCEKWYLTHEKIYNAILNCGGSNIINPLDFFLYKNIYYLVTEKVTSCSVKFTEICRCSREQQDIILKVLAHEISCLAEKNIVHSDLKPENLILKSTVLEYFTVKIIDFDASFFAHEPPDPDDITGDQVYFSPEMLLYMAEEDAAITPKSDVFALGILFHIVLCGETPKFDPDYDCLGQAVLNGDTPVLSSGLSDLHRKLISDMLSADADERPSAAEVLKRLTGEGAAKPVKVKPVVHKTSAPEPEIKEPEPAVTDPATPVPEKRQPVNGLYSSFKRR